MGKIQIAGEEPALIQKGKYEVVCQGWALDDFKGHGKLVFTMCICEGGYSGLCLEKYFNVKLVRIANGEDTFQALPRSDYLRLMRGLFRRVKEEGGDYLSPDNLDGKKLLVEVEPVVRDYKKEPLEPEDQYSKVSKIITILDE